MLRNYPQRVGKYERGVKRPKGQMKMFYAYLIRVPEGQNINNNKAAIFEGIIGDNFSELMKDINNQMEQLTYSQEG